MTEEQRTSQKRAADLAASEQRYRLLVEASPNAIMAIREGHFLYTNAAGAHLLGFADPQEIIGLDAMDVVAPGSRELAAERIRRLGAGESNPQVEIELLRPDGSTVVAESTSIAINLPDGPAALIIAQDITERKQAQKRLHKSIAELATSETQLQEKENMLRESQAIAHIGGWSIKIGDEIVLCSDEAYRIFGLPVGSTCTFEMFSEVIHPDDREYVKNSWITALNNGQFDITYRILVDGQLRRVAVKAESMFHKEGQTISAIGIVQDITKHKQAEEALEERLQFQNLVATISTKFIGLSGVEFEQAIHDALAEIGRYFNSDTVRLYRLSLQGDVVKIRNQWRDEHLSPPKEMAEIHKMKYPNLAAYYSKGQATVFGKFDDSPQWPEMRKILRFFGTKAGVGVPLEVDSSGVDVFAMDKVGSEHVWPEDIVEQSKAVGKVILSAMRRSEAEEEAHRLRDEYTHMSRVAAMGELTASLAHELKQPLAAMRSNAQAAQRYLAKGEPDIDEVRDILADIISDNRRASEVIARLRGFMQRREFTVTQLNINDAISEVLPLIHSDAIIKNVSLRFELDETVPLVVGDRIQLQQVILNLVLNGSEAMIGLDSKLRKMVVQTKWKDSKNLVVAVRDNGTGIEEKSMDRLFEPFYTTKERGMGMGLAICKSIVEAHRGRLWAENNPDQGATFYFTLPVMEGDST